jgi:hypothetical protein
MALQDNLVAFYKFDESSGNAQDSVGTRNLTNTGSTAYNTGIINSSIDFGASNSTKKLEYVGSYGIAAGGSWTIAYWYRKEAAASFNGLIGFVYGSGTKSIILQRDVGQWSAYSQNGANNSSSLGVSTESNGTWHLIVVTGNSTTITCYRDGSTLGTFSNSGTISSTDALGVGTSSMWASAGIGRVDALGVWSREVTATEANTDLWNGGAGVQLPIASGPTNLKSLSGNLKSNIKSISGNLIANVKSLSGNS